MRQKIASEIREELIRLYLQGYSRAEIHETTAVSTGSISNILGEFGQELERGEMEAIHLFFASCRKAGVTASRAIAGARLSTMAEKLNGSG